MEWSSDLGSLSVLEDDLVVTRCCFPQCTSVTSAESTQIFSLLFLDILLIMQTTALSVAHGKQRCRRETASYLVFHWVYRRVCWSQACSGMVCPSFYFHLYILIRIRLCLWCCVQSSKFKFEASKNISQRGCQLLVANSKFWKAPRFSC